MKCFNKRWIYPTGHRDNGKWVSERIYTVWKDMLYRCNNPKSDSYKYYGAKGITVCNEWLSYDNFYEWAMDNGYNDTLTIERRDVGKGYDPFNCEWISKKAQLRNTTRSVKVENKCISQIAEEASIKVHTVQYRHFRWGRWGLTWLLMQHQRARLPIPAWPFAGQSGDLPRARFHGPILLPIDLRF